MHPRFVTLLVSVASAVGGVAAASIAKRQSTNRLVFAHFMIGIMSDRNSESDYDYDMQRAKDYGIDAFALNIGVDPYTDAQLNLAYNSAARIGMKVFISYDFNWWNVGQGSQIGSHLAGYASRPAQLIVDNKVFVSSFAGDGLDANALRNAVGRAVMWVPNYHPGQGNFNDVDGALNWMAWPNDGNNKAPKAGHNVTVEAGDASYISALGSKPYLAPVSPWFFTHYGPEVDYSKNWMFPSDTLWYDRWQHILTLAPRFIEIVTWNDYGESHYVGPLNSKHQDDGGSKWTNDMPHNAWLDMAKPFIAAYKAGATSVNSYIQSDQIIYWYRPNLRGLNCDSTDTTANTPANNGSGNYFMGRPDGWETALDNIYVVTLLKTAGTLTVSSGSNTQVFSAPAGAQIYAVPMGVGRQSFALARNGVNALAANSLKDVTNTCICGLYNFNAYTGSVPENFVDQAGPDALNRLVQGLKVQTCQPTPSLPTSAPPYTGPGGPGTTITSTSSSSTSTSGSSTITPPPTSTTSTVSTSTTRSTTTSSGGCTVTASEQIRPTNCMQPGCVWAGPPGSDDPDYCDGSRRRRSWFY